MHTAKATESAGSSEERQNAHHTMKNAPPRPQSGHIEGHHEVVQWSKAQGRRSFPGCTQRRRRKVPEVAKSTKTLTIR